MKWNKAIDYVPERRDFALYLGREGEPLEFIAYARTYADGETTLRELIASIEAETVAA